MQIKTAEFLMSNTDLKKCPEANLNEYAFIGRSNVGKSSLINMLTNNSGLAKTSSTPGKTQHLNHFLINKSWYLVDLPGYGYAKMPKTLRAKFKSMIESYILKRTNLVALFVLIDCRHPAQKIDIEFLNWLGNNAVPFSLVFTKSDKLGVNSLSKSIDEYKLELLKYWETLPQIFVSSSVKVIGKEEILDYISELNKIIDAG
ncbi:MAG: ribosome biogenesis GTP-binding protein YihA/YsxC [Bacteroidales bacterium]|nr:ribosome biogenesis GTP-binding protein YihA/YsxC [Bacteroidales bacterium]MDD4217014.1 ribosome biogenesis GTP-binding protein YihA/YsxC [Bacteroidales bacterium]MDY0141865.1 ribosome biogenesis GTP-binding protein YihA/YsxC [Bacteroidales bacterium]